MAETEASNFYEILGVSPRATHDEIEDAYHDLARELHPDVTDDDLESTARYMLVNEAYQTLSKGESREKYDDSIGLERPSAEKQAKERFVPKRTGNLSDMRLLDIKLKRAIKMARKLCDSGSFWQATRLLEGFLSTHENNPKLRRILAIAAAGRHRYHEATDHMSMVCKVEYYNAANYALLGNIYMRAGQLDLAESVLNEALTWDENLEEASRDLLRISELRAASQPVLKRLLGKLNSAITSKKE